MVRCLTPSSTETFLDHLLDFWIDWQITFLMLLTMSLQLFLVLAGFFRKHVSNRAFHLSIWVAFLGIDAFAAYALGLMLGSGCDNVFSLYAPILLFHLSAVDAINAYSPADNDLWYRYAFKLCLEVVAAAYILSRSEAECLKYLPSGMLLFVVGAFKYCERIYCLRGGSQAQILISARPVYKFMALPDSGQQHRLLVAGERETYEKFIDRSDKLEQALQADEEITSEALVTYNDIANCTRLQHLVNYINDVCLAYALFKIYRRRLTNLPIYHKDDDFRNVRQILFGRSARDYRKKVLKVIDLELSFIFDGIFSKGAGGRLYQGVGIVTRLVSAVLLVAAAMNLIVADHMQPSCAVETSSAGIHFGVGMVHLLVTVALLVECLQIYKLVRSNWIRVWLACTYITEERRQARTPSHSRRNKFHKFNLMAICAVFPYVGKPKSTHWSFKMEQLSIVGDCMHGMCMHFLALTEINCMCKAKDIRQELDNLNELSVFDLQEYLVEKLECMSRMEVVDIRGQIHPQWPGIRDGGLEEAVLNWHLATSVCELDLITREGMDSITNGNGLDKDVRVSIGLSRYCLHLLVRRSKLMPEDPDVARGLYKRFKDQLKHILLQHRDKKGMVDALLRGPSRIDEESLDESSSSRSEEAESVDRGIQRGRQLMQMQDRWTLLADVWVNILIYIASSANAHPHTLQMAKGGELLTHLWVLLGHLGFGQRSWLSMQQAFSFTRESTGLHARSL